MYKRAILCTSSKVCHLVVFCIELFDQIRNYGIVFLAYNKDVHTTLTLAEATSARGLQSDLFPTKTFTQGLLYASISWNQPSIFLRELYVRNVGREWSSRGCSDYRYFISPY